MLGKKVLGGDYGGQNFPVAITNIGKIIKRDEFPTKVRGRSIRDQFEYAINEISKDYDIDAAFVATAGTLDLERGAIKFSPNIPQMSGYPMAEKMSNILDIDIDYCGIGNDATIAIYGEYVNGGYREDGITTVTGNTLGTGTGGGAVVESKPFVGYDGKGSAMEMHFSIGIQAPIVCGCGLYDCFEANTKAAALNRMAEDALIAGKETILEKQLHITKQDDASWRIDKKLLKQGPKIINDAAKDKDKVALEIWKKFRIRLGKGIDTLSKTYHPQLHILVGKIASAYPYFIDPLKEQLKMMEPSPEIKVSQEPGKGGLYGALTMAKVLAK